MTFDKRIASNLKRNKNNNNKLGSKTSLTQFMSMEQQDNSSDQMHTEENNNEDIKKIMDIL